jgi:hypothetical protein
MGGIHARSPVQTVTDAFPYRERIPLSLRLGMIIVADNVDTFVRREAMEALYRGRFARCRSYAWASIVLGNSSAK